MISVATGPMNSEINHHHKPLRNFPCASPELIRDKVPQPAYHPTFDQTYMQD